MDLIVQKRERFGKANKSLREEGFIPAELYGHGIENVHLTVPEKNFIKLFKEAGESTVVNLRVENAVRPALIQEVQRDYRTGNVTHIDFYQVRMDEKIRARIPIEFQGEAPAVKEKGGFLNKSLAEIEVESLPGDLPHNFPLALGVLDDIGKSLYVKDLHIPEAVKILIDLDTVVVTVTPPAKEEEVPAPADLSAVKVETEEKKAERARASGVEEAARENPEAKKAA